VRISHATTIVPEGIWKKVKEDEREVDYNDDETWKFPEFEALKLKENWVHHTPSILNVYNIIINQKICE